MRAPHNMKPNKKRRLAVNQITLSKLEFGRTSCSRLFSEKLEGRFGSTLTTTPASLQSKEASLDRNDMAGGRLS